MELEQLRSQAQERAVVHGSLDVRARGTCGNHIMLQGSEMSKMARVAANSAVQAWPSTLGHD